MSRLYRSAIAALIAVSSSLANAAGISATLYKSPTCGCCEAYVSYLRQNGFEVKAINRDDMDAVHKQNGIGQAQSSCHTMRVAGYTIEGHVPVAAIKRLLKEKPAIAGLTVPGMVANSPGMGAFTPGSLPVMTLQATPVVYGRF